MTGIFDFAVNQMAQLRVNYSASSDYKHEICTVLSVNVLALRIIIFFVNLF